MRRFFGRKILGFVPGWIALALVLGGTAVAASPVFHGVIYMDASQGTATQTGTTGPTVVAQATAVPTMQPGNPFVASYVMGDGVTNGIWDTCNSCGIGTFPNGHYHVLWENLLGDALGPGSVAVGPAALNGGDQSTNGWNTAVGQAPMEGGSGTGNCVSATLTGYSNTAIGGYSMRCIGAGYRNSGLGVQSLYDITSGYENVGIGFQSGYNITTGYNNVFVGDNSGNQVTSDYENVMIGTASGQNQTGVQGSTFVGFKAGNSNVSGTANTYLGHLSGLNETTGNNNTFMGESSGYHVGTATDNTFVGRIAGFNATGSYNSAFGSGAGQTTTTGQYNLDLGYNAGGENTGTNNVDVGYNAGARLAGGAYNTLVGSGAGSFITGNDNTRIGGCVSHCSQITSGSQNLLLGFDVAAPVGGTANGQISILNAMYGCDNTGTGGSVSTGGISFYTTTCSDGYVTFGKPLLSSSNSGQISCSLSASNSCTATLNVGTGFTQCVVSLDYGSIGSQSQYYPLLGRYVSPNVTANVQTTTALTGTVKVDYVCL